jgi:hypothetical protein
VAIPENEILNPKSETLNKFKIQIPNVQNGLGPDLIRDLSDQTKSKCLNAKTTPLLIFELCASFGI